MMNIMAESTPEDWRRWCDWYLRTWSGRNKWIKGEHWAEFKNAQQTPELISWVDQSPNNELAIEAFVQWVSTTDCKGKKSELWWVPLHPAIPTKKEAKTLAELHTELAPHTGWPDSNKGFKPFAKFLDGGWLEDYVLDCTHKIAAQCNFDRVQSRASVEVKRKEKSANFEFDVAVLKGYRLFGISCSTSTDKPLLKHKLFEVYTRARQMGGDEARVALVGGYVQTDNLLEEVNEEWFAPQDVIRVFGPQDWPDLETKLTEWFNWQPS
jgi:hypothetical protein